MRQIQSFDALMIIDDSIPHMDENDIIAWHYDHTSCQNIKEINFVTALYHANDVSLPVNYHLIKKTKTVTIQSNHFFASLCSFIKLEMLKV